MVPETVKGTVEFESNIAPNIMSAPREIWVAHNPSGPGELPEAFDVMVEHFSEDLGVSVLYLNSPPSTLLVKLDSDFTRQSDSR